MGVSFQQIGRPSIIGSELGSAPPTFDQASLQDKSQVSDNEFPLHEEDAPLIPFDDSPEPRQDLSLVSATPDNKRTSLNISGLDVVAGDNNEGENHASTNRAIDEPRRRRRKRRIEIDNDKTELSSDHIKAMLRDTSDIVRQNRTHPADYVPQDDEVNGFDLIDPRPWKKPRGPYYEEVASLPYERLLARPNIADNGALAPELLALWDRNSSRLRGEALPFRMRGESGEDQRSQLAEDMMNEAAEKEAEDIEMGRRDDENELVDDSRLSIEQGEEEEFPQNVDNEMPNPFDEEEEELAQEKHEEAIGFAEDMVGMASPARSENSQRSSFSLGAVNDLEEEIAGESRQEQGDILASSGSKWHNHTVKVLDMLKRNMTSDEKDDEMAKDLSYDKLSYGVSRRTACGVFFELLQLRTWDFIELSQRESYADIKIAPGARFNERPPSERLSTL